MDQRLDYKIISRKTIAIFGGSFDPPTIAHIQISAEIYNSFEDIDEVWIVPCGDGRNDKSLRTKGKKRIDMLNLILSDLIDQSVPIKVNSFEIDSEKYWPTYDLLKEFQSQYPNYKFIFSLGTDLIDGISTWNNSSQLLEEFEFIICKRVNYNPSIDKYPQNYRVLEGYIDASSTRIRNRIHRNLNQRKKLNLGINGMTTQSVIKYICANNLYSVKDCACNVA